MREIYDRQRNIDLNTPKSVMIIGCGGVGAWVAFNLALSGVKKLILVDHDEIEESNLNRTPFKVGQIGEKKVDALNELIAERRHADITPIPMRIEDVPKRLYKDIETVIDCKDNGDALPNELDDKVLITGGYDGSSITIHERPDKTKTWGDGPTGYTVTPSWLVPPQFIANMITLVVCTGKKVEEDRSVTMNMEEVYDVLFK